MSYGYPPRNHLNGVLPVSGYDFGYFLKLLTALSLPTTEEAFFERLQKWFPISYDMKTMMRVARGLRGGLQEVADDLGVSAPPSAQECCPTHTCSPSQQKKNFLRCTNYMTPGDAHRTIPPGRLRFAPHGVHVLQNARPVLPRAGRLRRIQRQALRTRRHFFADERPARSRAWRRNARRA